MNSLYEKDQVPQRIADIYDRLSKMAGILRKSHADLAVRWGWLGETFGHRRDFYRGCRCYDGLEGKKLCFF